MNEKIKVIRKQPGGMAEIAEIENKLEILQNEVGGNIEMVTMETDFAFVLNAEGKQLGLAPNFKVPGDIFCGPVLIVGVNGEEIRSMTDWECDIWLMLFQCIAEGEKD